MKTERRHELQTNVLADWMGHKLESIRPYSKLIVGAIGAVFIVAIATTIISNQQWDRSAKGWADFYAASAGDSPDRLRTVAEEHAGTLPAMWAMQREADLELARGIRSLYVSRGEAIEALGLARKLYEQVESGAIGQAELRQAAQFGMGQCYEAEGEVDKARGFFEKAVASGKDSPLGKQANTRLERLNDKDAAEWLVWFSRQTPQPRAPQGEFPGGFPGGAGGLDLPNDLLEIPDRPELSIPTPTNAANERAESSLPVEDPAPPPAGDSTEPSATGADSKTSDTNTPEAKTPDANTPEAKGTEPTTPAPSETSPKAGEAAGTEPTAPAAAAPSAPSPAPAPTTPAADAPAVPPADGAAADGAASD